MITMRYGTMTTAIQTDWRCSDDRMKLRQEVLSILLEKYGSELNEDGSPNTAHTTNPVPLILVEKDRKHGINSGILGDIAPTVLDLMDIEKPEAMTQKSLLKPGA